MLVEDRSDGTSFPKFSSDQPSSGPRLVHDDGAVSAGLEW